MHLEPLISVLLPYRNAAGTLDEALDSVLGQEGVQFEVIAVDDGSTDGGSALVARRADPRIVALSSGGMGIVGALTTALRAARGGLIARMDADDVCLPGRLKRQAELLRSDGRLGVVGTWVEAFPEAAVGEGLRLYVEWLNGLVTSEEHTRDLFVESPLCHPSVMMRREALEEAGGWREVPWAEDYDLWLRLDQRGWRMAKVPELLLRWRHLPGRATFADPRYAPERFREAKAQYLAPKLLRLGRPVDVWGAGPTGRRLVRALEPHGVRAERFIDIDPRKIGRAARGAPVVGLDGLRRGEHTLVVAVGARGARELIRRELAARGFAEGEDYLCAA